MKKKRILTEEQKAQRKIYMAEYCLKNKAKAKITSANWYQDNKEDQKRQSQEWKKDNPDKVKLQRAKFKENSPDYISPCRIEDPDYDKEQSKRFHKANPGYSKEHNHKHALGYWVVYLIHNFDGQGNIYCGQTQNIYMRMASHKSVGTLNSDKYELIKQCETHQDALEFEAYMHEQGYHGYNNGK